MLIPAYYEPDRKKPLGGTDRFSFLCCDLMESLIICRITSLTNHATNQRMITFQDGKWTRLSSSLVRPGPVWAEVRGQTWPWWVTGWRGQGQRQSGRSKQTATTHWGWGRTPLASLPAGPSAPRRWSRRPLSVEMHKAHTWERLSRAHSQTLLQFVAVCSSAGCKDATSSRRSRRASYFYSRLDVGAGIRSTEMCVFFFFRIFPGSAVAGQQFFVTFLFIWGAADTPVKVPRKTAGNNRSVYLQSLAGCHDPQLICHLLIIFLALVRLG